MIFKKVAVCGSPLTGKTTILHQIAQITGSERIRTWQRSWENRTRLDVTLSDITIVFVSITGKFLPNRVDLVSEILSNANAVIYVSSTNPPRESENIYFSLYQQEAIRLNTFWTEIPWIFVLNKMGDYDQNPFLQHIPVKYHSEIVPCVATQGLGIEQIWQKIVGSL